MKHIHGPEKPKSDDKKRLRSGDPLAKGPGALKKMGRFRKAVNALALALGIAVGTAGVGMLATRCSDPYKVEWGNDRKDAGNEDAEVKDAGPDAKTDGKAPDANAPDANLSDALVPDGTVHDANVVDAEIPDAQVTPDAEVQIDGAAPDAQAQTDAGPAQLECAGLYDASSTFLSYMQNQWYEKGGYELRYVSNTATEATMEIRCAGTTTPVITETFTIGANATSVALAPYLSIKVNSCNGGVAIVNVAVDAP
ncbi:MAG: hypothetical protein V1827_03685 [Candidatus Micrarchaeota archaeon]